MKEGKSLFMQWIGRIYCNIFKGHSYTTDEEDVTFYICNKCGAFMDKPYWDSLKREEVKT